MRRLILIAVMSALVLGKPKPETYKETEDFKYARSSSDDGTKSGFYGAQRGNMGGNYERAHNMDTLAQNQMSGLVRQVDGELGDGAITRTGSVFTAANSRGIYGSGTYDLSNLSGRNFAEGGESTVDSQSQLSATSRNSRYRGQSYSGVASNSGFSSGHAQHSSHSGYQTSSNADQSQIDNLQAVDKSQDLGRYESGNQAGYNMKYHTQYGARGRTDVDHSSANLYSTSGHDANSQAQYITTPVRVVVRPGGRVAIPITAPTYSVSQNALTENRNALNTDAEILSQQSGFAPTNKAKQYETSYSYRKQWEKHHEVPGYVSVAVPTEIPFPKNSELYEDAQLLQSSKNQFQDANSLLAQSTNMNNGFRGYTKSGSSRSRLQASHDTQQGQSVIDSQQTQDGFNSQQGQSALDLQQRQGGSNSQQSQSGMSAHQSHSGSSSLQRQSGLDSQQWHSGLRSQQSHLGFNDQQSASSASSGGYANAYGRSAQASGLGTGVTNTVEDINLKPKSYHSSYSYHKSWERQGDPYVIKPVGGTYGDQTTGKLTAASSNNGAYSNNQYGSHSRQAHQSYSADCEDEAHTRVARSPNSYQQLEQDQNQWEDLGQQTQSKWENLEELGQQQNKWDNLETLRQQQQNKWDNLQDVGQQTQTQWDNLQQLGQETQNNWDNLQQLGQQTQDKWDNLEDLSQHTHRDLKQNQNKILEDFGEHIQNEGGLTNFEQQVNSQSEDLDIFSQLGQKEEAVTNFKQQAAIESGNRDISNQKSQNEDSLTNFEQEANNQNEKWDIFNHHSKKEDLLTNFEQQTNVQNTDSDIFSQHNQKEDKLTNFEQQANSESDNRDIFNQKSQNEDLLKNFEQANNQNEKWDIFNQHSQKEGSLVNFEQQANGEDVFHKNNFQQENQFSGFPVSPNDDFIHQQVQSENKLHNDGSEFVHNQQNSWFHPIAHGVDTEKNTDSYDFIKPISQWKIDNDKSPQQHVTDKSITGKEKQNLFTLPPTTNKLLPLSTEQDVFRNTNEHFGHSFWNSNKFEHQFENSFAQNSSKASANGNPLEGLWDKIDNIAGEITVNEGKTEDKKILLNNYSNFNLHSQNVNHMQNGFSWSILPVNPYKEVPNSMRDPESVNKNSEQKNIFDEPIQSSSTPQPTLSSHHTTGPVQDVEIPINPYKHNQNVNSQDVGRGDIGPEETIFEDTASDKIYKNQKEIQPLNLTKEAEIPNSHRTSMKNKDKYSGNGSSDFNSHQQKSTNKQTVPPLNPTTTPTVKISTTMKINTNDNSAQQVNQPMLDIHNLNKIPLPGLEKHIPHQQTVLGAIPIPTNDLHGYDQQDMDLLLEVNEPKNMQDQTSIQDFSQQSQQNMDQMFGVFGPPKNMQDQILIQDFGQQSQQNTDQILEGFEPPNNIQDQTTIQDFGQLSQNPFSSLGNVQSKDIEGNLQQVPDNQILSTIHTDKQHPQISTDSKDSRDQAQEIVEPSQISRNIDINSNEEIRNMQDQIHKNMQEQILIQDFGQQSQQNTDQILEGFEPPNNIQDQTTIQDFGQLSQNPFSSLGNVQSKDIEGNPQQVPDIQILSTIHTDKQHPQISTDSKDSRDQAQEIVEPSQISRNIDINYNEDIKNVEDIKSEDFLSPVEATSENPGFWESVGNKLSNAKSKVFSWFQKS